MHTVVRVRILHADVASDASYAERVQREAEAASGIHHPNIVEIVDVGVASGRSFVVRELVEGATLADLLAGGGNIREEEARRIGEPPAPTTLAPTLPAATPRRRASALPALLVAVPLLLALLFAALTFRPPAPRDTAVLSATTTPATTASPAPTSLPPVEATPEPTSLPTPEAIAEATAAPPVAVPTAAPPAAAEPAQTSSTATVSSFYALINQEQYDQAAALWSPRMQASYPPSTNIYGRFDRTREIVVRGLAQVAEGFNAATVTVDLLEVLDSGVTRHWIGQGQLVWDGSRWLMDTPNLRPA